MKRPVRLEQVCLKVSLPCVFLLVVHLAWGKRNDDVVVMKNGDTFTGEIKDLQHGELSFKSDYMKDSVHLDWKRVQSVRSKDMFIVVLSDGRRLSGTIQKATSMGKENDFTISWEQSAVEVPPADVIRIEQRELSVWNQLTGSVNYGLSFADGNSKTVNSSLGADVAFNTEENSIRLSGSSQFDSQSDAQNTNRFTFDTQLGRALTTRWIATGLFSLLKSNQQNLNL